MVVIVIVIVFVVGIIYLLLIWLLLLRRVLRLRALGLSARHVARRRLRTEVARGTRAKRKAEDLETLGTPHPDPPLALPQLRGNHLSNTTCLTQVFFKCREYFDKLW